MAAHDRALGRGVREPPGNSWTGFYLVAALRGRALYRRTFAGLVVTDEQVLFDGTYGRLRAVVEGQDGGAVRDDQQPRRPRRPAGGDDRILRIVPPAA